LLRVFDNRYIQIEVLQQGIDVTLRLIDPAGTTLAEVDSPNSSYGPEPLMWIAEVGGTYRLEVFVPDKDARPGRYRLSYQASRTPTEEDKESAAGQRAYREAQKRGLEPEPLAIEVNDGLNAESRCHRTAPAYLTKLGTGYYRFFSDSNVRLFWADSNYTGRYIFCGVDADANTSRGGSLGSLRAGTGITEVIITSTP